MASDAERFPLEFPAGPLRRPILRSPDRGRLHRRCTCCVNRTDPIPYSAFRENQRVSHARGWIDAIVILDVVKADPDPANVTSRIGRSAKANKRVHLAHGALGAACQSEPDLAVPHPRFELVEQQQGLTVYIDIDAAVAFALLAGSYLRALQQGMQFCR